MDFQKQNKTNNSQERRSPRSNNRFKGRRPKTSNTSNNRSFQNKRSGGAGRTSNRENFKGRGRNENRRPEKINYDETEEFVLPGEVVGTVEEYSAGPGTTIVSGEILSLYAGNIAKNDQKRLISVVPTARVPNILNNGDVVYGRITTVRNNSAYVDIVATEKMPNNEIVNKGNAEIYVSNVQNDFTKSVVDEYKTLDIVRAFVIDDKKIDLSTVGNDFGVVKAFCSNCKTGLENKGSYLECPSCNNKENRKVSNRYGEGIETQ